MKFSVVIPTMWRSERTIPMLHALEASEHIGEIIIVDNDTSKCPDLTSVSKLVYLPQKENIYVNPAWNLGVDTSSCDYVCILNDDISFDVEIAFYAAIRNFNMGHTLVGLHQLSYDSLPAHKIASKYYGFGCCIFIDKSDWKPIPDQLKIWFGDTWLIENLKSHGFIVVDVETEMSTTSNIKELSTISLEDQKAWREISLSRTFSIGYIRHDQQVFDRFLGHSLNRLNGTFEVLSTSDEACPAKNYNELIDKSKSNILILTHQDVSFSSDLLERIQLTIDSVKDWGVLAMVGAAENGVCVWSRMHDSFEISSSDCCFIVINKEHGVRFDEETFDDFHCYVEDYCAQVREKTGLPTRTILTFATEASPYAVEPYPTWLSHHSVTVNKRGPAWGKYWEYRKKLEDKWPGIKTT